MSTQQIIVIANMVVIFLAAIFLGGVGGAPKSTIQAEWAWAVTLSLVSFVEVILLVWVRHTYSGQMQFWVQRGPGGSLMAIFWGYLLYHFTVEPLIRAGGSILKQ